MELGSFLTKIPFFLFLKVFLLTSKSYADTAVFDLNRLPKGKNVTLPRPATTLFYLNSRVNLKATDMPQSLIFALIYENDKSRKQVKLAIYDKHADRVHYAIVKTGTPFIYPFHAIDPITVLAENVETGNIADIKGIKIKVESNKPLEIGH